mmetsp:Transcript_29101/g.48431  ORF Transcript_29101/g.48431 Transcript_29101/m.48431 type:complete len:213 (-) Transcript_29101:112-750(-)
MVIKHRPKRFSFHNHNKRGSIPNTEDKFRVHVRPRAPTRKNPRERMGLSSLILLRSGLGLRGFGFGGGFLRSGCLLHRRLLGGGLRLGCGSFLRLRLGLLGGCLFLGGSCLLLGYRLFRCTLLGRWFLRRGLLRSLGFLGRLLGFRRQLVRCLDLDQNTLLDSTLQGSTHDMLLDLLSFVRFNPLVDGRNRGPSAGFEVEEGFLDDLNGRHG